MKTPIVFISIATGINLAASAATGGGGGGTAGGNATAPAGTGPVTPSQSGVVNRNQVTPPSIQNRPYSPAVNATASNSVSTNQFGANSNQLQGSNNLTPTGAATGTNEFNSNFVLRDHAVTDADQALLVTLRQEIRTQLGVTSPESMLVHFFINNGVVTVVGHVPSAAERNRILLQIQQTAGVSQVIDRLHIGTPPAYVRPETEPAFVGATSDHAFSAYDQGLLTRVRQTAAVQLGLANSRNTSPVLSAQLPVHFSVQNGIVSVTGVVMSEPQRQALLTAIGRVPGVVRVVDDLQIGAASNFAPAPQSTSTNP